MVLDQLWDNSEMIGGKMCLISEDNFYTLSICSVIISSIKAVLLLSGNEEILFFYLCKNLLSISLFEERLHSF